MPSNFKFPKVYLGKQKSDTRTSEITPTCMALQYLQTSFYWGVTFMLADKEKLINLWTSEDW